MHCFPVGCTRPPPPPPALLTAKTLPWDRHLMSVLSVLAWILQVQSATPGLALPELHCCFVCHLRCPH